MASVLLLGRECSILFTVLSKAPTLLSLRLIKHSPFPLPKPGPGNQVIHSFTHSHLHLTNICRLTILSRPCATVWEIRKHVEVINLTELVV